MRPEAEARRSRIRAESTLGQGSCFTCWLPQAGPVYTSGPQAGYGARPHTEATET